MACFFSRDLLSTRKQMCNAKLVLCIWQRKIKGSCLLRKEEKKKMNEKKKCFFLPPAVLCLLLDSHLNKIETKNRHTIHTIAFTFVT